MTTPSPRTYYAAFHAAQAMLASQGLEADTHAGVRTLFHLHFIKLKRIDPKFEAATSKT
jgi:uncharacterized protein (UPF0332 family)